MKQLTLLVDCWSCTSWQHGRSHQYGDRLVTVRPNGDFIVLSHWEFRLPSTSPNIPFSHIALKYSPNQSALPIYFPNELYIYVISVMKMKNIVLRMWLEPTLLRPGQFATFTPHRIPDVTTTLTPTCLCSFLPQRSVETCTHVLLEL